MQQTILIVSTDQALVREMVAHFEDNESFRIYVAGSDEETLNQAASRKTDVVILDGEGRTTSLSRFINDLVAIQPDIKIFLFPPDNNPLHPELEEITVNVMLQRPFSPRELDAFLGIVLGEKMGDLTFNEIPDDEESEIEEVGPEDLADYLGEAELQNLDEMLGNMPPPDPGISPDLNGVDIRNENQDLVEETLPPVTSDTSEAESEWIHQDVNSLPDIPSLPDEDLIGETSEIAFLNQTENKLVGDAEKTSQLESEPSMEPLSIPESVEEPEPGVEPEPLIIESVSPVAQASYPGTSPLGVKSVRFDYYCVLIPDNPDQFLARDLSDRLGFILPQIHISQGWRVTSLSVRPLFLMWRISLPADICPVDAVNEIRQRTTSHFYTNFPELLNRNKESDFWAPGYIILSGQQAPSASLIENFIQRTRSVQQKNSG